MVADWFATRSLSYDPTTGMLTGLDDSDAGSFSASYDPDGNLAAKSYPNGLRADFVYDEAGAATALSYVKESGCASDCVWFSEQVSESAHGQWVSRASSLSDQRYSYDRAGRLTGVEDTVGGQCATRAYGYDGNSNRTSATAYLPGAGGVCSTSSPSTSQGSSYDGADRIANQGFDYDSFGRVTRVPATHSGGGPIDYSYYVDDMVRSISQDGVSKTYELDPAGRHRQTTPGGGTSHYEVLRYGDSSDSPAIAVVMDGQDEPVSGTRQIVGIDGDLAAIRTIDIAAETDETALQLSNLHGDTIATASLDPQATGLLDTFESDEFGNPRQTTTTPRYGWLGAKQRRTELPSGVIQMGVRSYVPAMGRFTSVDPVVGGSATAYDYGNADPVNQVDLDGRCVTPNPRIGRATFYFCKTTTRKIHRKVRRHGSTAARVATTICGALIGAGPLGVVAAAGCSGIVLAAYGSVKRNLRRAVRRKACFTFTVPIGLFPDTLPHFGNSKNRKHCKRG